MKKYKILINSNLKVGKIEDTMYSSFIEHLGRAVYGGIYEPTHPNVTKDGFRKDVIETVKNLDLSLVRYPGGNFVSGYNWEDGIGPRENRPQKTEEAWHSIEPNYIGTDEFMIWCKETGVKPMMAVNMGRGTTDSARNLVEYCNSNGDGDYANLRRKNASDKPYDIKYWSLGNEMDGEWQIGHLPSDQYAAKAHEAAVKMKEIDPSIKLIACGSSTIDMPTFPEWDRIVIENLYNDIDYLSVHQYFFESTTEDDYFASHLAMEKYIDTLRHVLAYCKKKTRSEKDIYLCFDEFNVWYNNKPLPEEYSIGPAILEENQSIKDTLVFAGLIDSLLKNCDVIKIACLAQLINVIAPIMTEKNGKVLLNTIYYPYFNASKFNRGETLKSFIVEGDTFDSRFGKAHYISDSFVINEKELVINLTNYAKEDIELEINATGFDKLNLVSHIAMFDDDLNACNTMEHPERVLPKEMHDLVKVENEKIIVNLRKLSWNCIRFSIK